MLSPLPKVSENKCNNLCEKYFSSETEIEHQSILKKFQIHLQHIYDLEIHYFGKETYYGAGDCFGLQFKFRHGLFVSELELSIPLGCAAVQLFRFFFLYCNEHILRF